MNESDVQKEWSALAEAYAVMSNEELSSLAEHAYELTDLARQALQAEIKARGITANLVETSSIPPESADEAPRGDLDPEELDLMPLNRVWEPIQARDIMKTLYEAGVPAYLGPDNAENIEEFRGNFEVGVDIRVRAVDRNRALTVLAASSPKNDDHNATEKETPLPHCPSCNSEEIVFVELVPAPATADSPQADKFRWRCDACGHEWEDDGIEE